MSSRNDRFTYGLATPRDSRQLLEVFESGNFPGKIAVLFTRRPDPYQSLMHEGDSTLIPVIKDVKSGNICAVGCCVIRKAFINGKVRNTGYLTGLKIMPRYRQRLPYMADVYAYLYEQTKNAVDIFYTTILKDNASAQRLLVKGHSNLPRYHYLGEYTVYCFRTGKTEKSSRIVLEKGNSDELQRFYETQLKQLNFSPVHPDLYGLSAEDHYTLRDANGEILAACGVWDQQSYKQYLITGYSGIYRHLKNIPLQWLGYPNLPRENSPINYASIALLSVKDNDPQVAEVLLKQVAARSPKYDFLMVGLFENHPLNAVFAKIKQIKYQSGLYTVHWDDRSSKLDGRAIHLEVGLL